jgi:CcmD family protein
MASWSVTMRRMLLPVVMTLMLGAGSALAQTQPAPQPPAAQDGFVPVDAPVNGQDTMPAPRLVATAYAFIWVVLFGYLWSIRRRLTTVEREMAAITRRTGAGPK